MRKASIIILAVLLALFAFVSCDQSVGDLFGFDLMFNANGGTGSMEPVFIKGSSTTAPASAYTRTGYTFTGWNTEHDGSGTEYKVGDVINGYDTLSIKLYAQWVANTYQITIGSSQHGYASALTYQYKTDEVNEQAIPLNIFPYEGYRFSYFTITGGASVDVNNGYLLIPAGNASDITITPSFSANDYVVVYNANGGTGTMDSQSFTFDEQQNLTANAFTKSGYEFANWSTTEGGMGEDFYDEEPVTNLASEKGQTVVLYAQWNAVPYTITVADVEHGYAEVMFDKYTVSNENIFIPVTPEPYPGYSLDSFTVDNAGAKIDPFTGNLVIYAGTTGDINITATFLPNMYFVEFDANCTDATGAMLTETMYYDMGKELDPVEYAREGYTFAGWNTEPDGTGIPYYDKEVVSNLSEELIDTVTLYAQWNPTVYFVHFTDVEHGHATALYDMYIVDGGDTYIPLHAVADNGYMFIMFEVAEGPAYIDFTGEYLVIPAGTASDIEVTPYFLIRPYWINITESTQGIVSADTIFYTMSDEDQTVELTVLPEVGNALFDWKFDGPLGITIKNNILTIPAGAVGDITITPIFLPAFQVTLVKNCGTVETGYDVENYFFSNGAILPTADHFTRTGHTFNGWYDNSEFSGDPILKITTTDMGDKTFYAKWSVVTYTVKFFKNSASATGSMSDESFQYDESKALTTNGYSRTGYTFANWNTVETPTETTPGTTYTNGQTVSNLRETAGDVNLYAQWTANTYKVKFNKNATSATGTMADESFTYGEKKNLTTNAFTRTGYTFSGWNTVATPTQQQPGTHYDDGAEVQNLSSTQGAEVTLYAQWTPITYKVKFNTNSGTGTMGDESFTYDVSKALSKNTFTKTGYTFTGWNTVATPTQEEPGTAYGDEQNVSNLSSTKDDVVNLHAQWTANTYTVKFDKNAEAATGSMTDQSFVYDVTKKLKVNTYKNIGYRFTGWNTKADGTGTGYADKASVSNLSTAPDGEVTLYAQWEKETYSISFTSGTEGYTVQPDKDTYQYDPENGILITLTITGAVPYIDTYAINGPSTASLAFDKENSTVTIQSGSYGGPIEVTCYFVTDYKTITFKANGGEGDDTTENVPTGVEWELDANPFTYQGMVFAGWSTSADGDIEFADQGKITTDEDMTLYAKWIDAEPLTDTTTELIGGKTYLASTSLVSISSRVTINGTEPVTIIVPAGYAVLLNKGISVFAGQTLNIEGDGGLAASGPDQNAGIGGTESDPSCGTINISGGSVFAVGGSLAAGIGGGRTTSTPGNGGTVTISGGHVEAFGGQDAAAIGGSQGGDGGSFTITGGSLFAQGNYANQIPAIGMGNFGQNEGTITVGDGVALLVSYDGSNYSPYTGTRTPYMAVFDSNAQQM